MKPPANKTAVANRRSLGTPGISTSADLPNTRESGIFISLPPGQFTAILHGKNTGAGLGLVEIYNLK